MVSLCVSHLALKFTTELHVSPRFGTVVSLTLLGKSKSKRLYTRLQVSANLGILVGKISTCWPVYKSKSWFCYAGKHNVANPRSWFYCALMHDKVIPRLMVLLCLLTWYGKSKQAAGTFVPVLLCYWDCSQALQVSIASKTQTLVPHTSRHLSKFMWWFWR